MEKPNTQNNPQRGSSVRLRLSGIIASARMPEVDRHPNNNEDIFGVQVIDVITNLVMDEISSVIRKSVPQDLLMRAIILERRLSEVVQRLGNLEAEHRSITEQLKTITDEILAQSRLVESLISTNNLDGDVSSLIERFNQAVTQVRTKSNVRDQMVSQKANLEEQITSLRNEHNSLNFELSKVLATSLTIEIEFLTNDSNHKQPDMNLSLIPSGDTHKVSVLPSDVNIDSVVDEYRRILDISSLQRASESLCARLPSVEQHIDDLTKNGNGAKVEQLSTIIATIRENVGDRYKLERLPIGALERIYDIIERYKSDEKQKKLMIHNIFYTLIPVDCSNLQFVFEYKSDYTFLRYHSARQMRSKTEIPPKQFFEYEPWILARLINILYAVYKNKFSNLDVVLNVRRPEERSPAYKLKGLYSKNKQKIIEKAILQMIIDNELLVMDIYDLEKKDYHGMIRFISDVVSHHRSLSSLLTRNGYDGNSYMDNHDFRVLCSMLSFVGGVSNHGKVLTPRQFNYALSICTDYLTRLSYNRNVILGLVSKDAERIGLDGSIIRERVLPSLPQQVVGLIEGANLE